MKNGEYILPGFALIDFGVQNYKGIKGISISNLPKEAKWIFLTGENGFGKTSVLQSIAKQLKPFRHDDTTNDDFEFRDWIPNDIDISESTFPSAKTVIYFDKEKRIYGRDLRIFPQKVSLCAYGSSRLNMASESSKQEENPIESLFDTQVLLRNIEYQLSRWAIKKESEKDEKKEFATKYETVTKLFIKLLNLKKIEIDFGTDVVYYYEKDETGEGYNKVNFHQLAAGYRNIISMVGDMILRLFDTQQDVYDPAELSGIVIIDELDLHLHPKWQKRLPGLLSKIFPRVQFIASTHSPIPLLGAPEHSVFLKVNRDAENGITVERLEDMEKQISNLLPNTILTSPIFGMRDIFPVTHDAENGIRTEDTYAEIEFNDQVKQELKSYLGTERAKELEQLFKSE